MSSTTSVASAPGKLPADEYERRRIWLDDIGKFTKSEHIEIIRILNKHTEEYSENNNGIFFNVAGVKQETFDALQLFLDFTKRNHQDLADREQYMSTLMKMLK